METVCKRTLALLCTRVSCEKFSEVKSMIIKAFRNILLVGSALTFVGSSTIAAQPTPTNDQIRAAAEKSRTGRTGGMTLEQARKVVVDCVNKAAGFLAISNTRKVPLNRLEDTLDELGITDTTRLNTLRRYLVRNEEIGVQSVPYIVGDKPGDKMPLRFYRFMVTSHDLLAINRKQKLSEVIQFIADTAGYSAMPIGTAYQILADCRVYANNRSLVNESKEIKVSDTIKSQLAVSVDEFAKCVVEDKTFGVPSVDFDSAHGDALPYFMRILRSDSAINGDCSGLSPTVCAVRDAVNDGLTFECVGKLMTKTSFVSLPKEALAGELAMTAIKQNWISENISFNKSSQLKDILLNGDAGVARLIDQLKVNICPQAVELSCVQGKNKGQTNTKRTGGTDPTDCNILRSITGASTVIDLVKEVEKVL